MARKDNPTQLDIDMTVLALARTFGITTYEPPTKGGGTVTSVGTLSDADQLAAVERLARAGFLSPKGDGYKSQKRRAQAYELTPAGRAALRQWEERPELTVAVARALHSTDLASVYGDLPLARRQIELRRLAAGTVRTALKALGCEYTATGGWHVTAYTTPENLLGFVNLAHGVAVETDVSLDPELVEAVTVPDQGDGVKASGAAAWTSPDAGLAELVDHGDGTMSVQRARELPGAPERWTQLLVDVRVSAGEATDVALESVSARVVTWGLRTCYGHPGEPGHTTLDHSWRAQDRSPIQDWPADDETRAAMGVIGARWLDSVARRMADLAGCGEAVAAALDSERTEEPLYAERGPGAPILPPVDIGAAIQATGAFAWRGGPGGDDYGYTPRSVARSCCNSTTDVMRNALREARVGRISAACDVSNVCGLRYYDLITYALERAVVQRLTPVAEALWQQMAPLVPSRDDGWDIYMRIQPVLRGLAAELANDLLRGIGDEASATEQQIVEAYYAHGPVSVDIPIARTEAA